MSLLDLRTLIDFFTGSLMSGLHYISMAGAHRQSRYFPIITAGGHQATLRPHGTTDVEKTLLVQQ
jgi:hypothetical protein